MKTVHEVLKTYDREKIISSYIYHYGDSLWQIPDDCPSSAKEIKEHLAAMIHVHIDMLLDVKPVPQEGWVLLAYHTFPDYFHGPDDVAYTLVCLKDEDFPPHGYSFEFDETQRIMGFYISDAYTTRYYLSDLLAYFIYESSFFGWEREDMEKEKDEIIRRVDEVESGQAQTIPAKEVWEKLGIFPEKRNLQEKELEDEIYKQIFSYNQFCLEREIECAKRNGN